MKFDWIKDIVRTWLNEEGIESAGRFYSSYKGIVEERDDPEVLGRLKISCPAVYGSETHDYWAEPKGMFSGKDIGFYAIPNKKDVVWVSFLGGDPRFPIWEYGPWMKKGSPSTSPDIDVFQTTAGHRLEFDNKTDKLSIIQKDKQRIVMTKEGIFVGNDTQNLGKFLDALFQLLEKTTTSTQLGAQPFINLADYIKLHAEIKTFLKDAD